MDSYACFFIFLMALLIILFDTKKMCRALYQSHYIVFFKI